MNKLLVAICIDENTGKFSTSKFMVMASFYFILFIAARALYLDREIKSVSLLQETFYSCCALYFGRRFSLKTKNMEVSSQRASTEDDKES